MFNRKAVGILGESLALEYLECTGHQLVTRNYRHGHGEIDLIMIREALLIFVEVKTRHSQRYGLPEETVTPRQQEKIKETAEAFLEFHRWDYNIRFDIISVLMSPFHSLEHFKDAY